MPSRRPHLMHRRPRLRPWKQTLPTIARRTALPLAVPRDLPSFNIRSPRSRSHGDPYQPKGPSGAPVIHSAGNTTIATAGATSQLVPLQPPGSGETLRNLLWNRRTAIFWDLDNVDFFAPSYSAPLQVRRLRALVDEAGAQLVVCRAYGNTDTVRRLAGRIVKVKWGEEGRKVEPGMRGHVGAAAMCLNMNLIYWVWVCIAIR
ncbi:hypothetical protein Vafri_1866 [Volvox africanus]|nr:hypothetical protein Vafri_1866 [Volvox africanus]